MESDVDRCSKAKWLRVLPGVAGFDLSCLWIAENTLNVTHAFLTRELGLESAGGLARAAPPTLRIEVDLTRRDQIHLIAAGRDNRAANPRVLASASFTRPHSDRWWSTAHQAGRILVAIGRPVASEEGRLRVSGDLVGIARLRVVIWPSGAGTAAAPSTFAG